MNELFFSIPILAIAVIYCIWKRYFWDLMRREKKMRHGVSRLLWAMATSKKSPTKPKLEETPVDGVETLSPSSK